MKEFAEPENVPVVTHVNVAESEEGVVETVNVVQSAIVAKTKDAKVVA